MWKTQRAWLPPISPPVQQPSVNPQFLRQRCHALAALQPLQCHLHGILRETCKLVSCPLAVPFPAKVSLSQLSHFWGSLQIRVVAQALSLPRRDSSRRLGPFGVPSFANLQNSPTRTSRRRIQTLSPKGPWLSACLPNPRQPKNTKRTQFRPTAMKSTPSSPLVSPRGELVARTRRLFQARALSP